MKTPAFWSHKGTISTLLVPLAVFYDMVSTIYRAYIRPVKLPVPVICVGNLTAGGSGKTPVALAIGQMVKERGVTAYFLSRGYGGKLKGPVLVDPKKHTAADVGDEPLLLARELPTIICKNRLTGAQFAMFKGAQCIIMDDGFQNPFLAKSLSLIVIDGRIGFGNERILPAGPLREDPVLGLRRTHAVIVLNRSSLVPPFSPQMPVFSARTLPSDVAAALKGQKIVAFCGIAYPQKFFDMLAAVGATLVEKAAFADHQPYRDADIKKLILRAHKKNALLVTTQKDFMRVPEALRQFVIAADITVEFDNPAALGGVLDFVLGIERPPPEEP